MRLVFVVSVLALLLAGCTAELPEQQAARQILQAYLVDRPGYDGTVHCTRNPRPWFVGRTASVFICTARRDDGDCDWFRVTAAGGPPRAALDRERAGCVLPL